MAGDDVAATSQDADDGDQEEDDEELPPPSPERVLRRAWALSAVALRGLAAMHDDRDDAGQDVDRLKRSIRTVALDDELEADEIAFIEAPAHSLTRQQIIDATWQTEGAVVLAWALGACPLPDHETQCDPADLSRSIGFLGPRPAVLDPPQLRNPDELEWTHCRLLGLHWRLRDFSLTRRPVDLRALAGGGIWFGGFDLEGILLIDDDLAIGDAPIARAEPKRVQVCGSIASERHQAIRWLDGCATDYSAVDTPT